MIAANKSSWKIDGMHMNRTLKLTHLIFIDRVLLFDFGEVSTLEEYQRILQAFFFATGMGVNQEKTILFHVFACEALTRDLDPFLPFKRAQLDDGFKYLGYYLNPSNYRISYW